MPEKPTYEELEQRVKELEQAEIERRRTAIGDEQGPANGLSGSDITERIQMEDALRESERRYREQFEGSRDGYVVVNIDGQIIDANQAYCDMLGYSLEEIKSMNDFYNITPERWWEWEREEIWNNRLMTRGFSGIYEKEYIRKDGTIFPVELQCYTVFENHGTPKYLWGVIRDVTERKRAEEELRESREVLQAVLNAIPVRVFWKDRDLKYLGCNTPFARDAGFEKAEEIIGKDDYEMGWREQAERYRADDLSVIESGRAKHLIEEPQTTPSGNQILLMTSKIPLRDAGGGIAGVLGTYMDVTDRMTLEAQLQQAQKMESVGRLAGGVAHDFNNMLSIIIGRAELALMDLKPTDSIYKDLLLIKKVGERSADLTHQLLAFARKQTIVPKPINLNDIIENMFKMLRQLIGEDIALLWKPAASLWIIKMDPAQIDQILANLVVNARDAIQNIGQVTIETKNVVLEEAYCSCRAGFVPGQYVMLSVSDNGCGMNPETMANIFEPFFTTKPVGQGTGLGLATVYGIVKQNSGFIEVQSEPDKGTIFKIYYPRYEGKVSQDLDEESKATATAGGTETILLVEDDQEILDVARIVLSKLGYNLLTGATPGEAIRLVETYEDEIHLLMTDVVMPEMNGRQLAERLLSQHPDLKCLFMSGYPADVIAHHGVLDQGVHFIQKPFSIRNLAAKVREALDSGVT